MTLYKKSIQTFITGFVALAFVMTLFMPRAQAATYYYQASNGNEAYIAALVAQINALVAQLQNKQYSNQYTIGGSGYDQPRFGNGNPKKHSNSNSNSRYDIDVYTEDANVNNDDSVDFVGEIDLGSAPYADVWFEYGTDRDLDEETDSERVTDDETFEIEVDDIDEDEQYYFRAVAEDPRGSRVYGRILGFEVDDDDNNDNDEDTPEVTTDDAEDIDEDSAEINGDIEMNDYENGIAFFVYGEDESSVEDAEDESEYNDVEEDGDDIKKFILSSNLDDDRSFTATISGLDNDTDHYFRICVEYDDEDDDETLVCGDVESFKTDED
jgi:hypothetical protein